MTSTRHRFGRFVLRPDSRELLADGQPLRLGERAFDLLLALVEAGGAVVARETLFERAWPGRVVLDDNLKVQMMALRRLLGADAIVTVPGLGYRLAVPVAAAPPRPVAAPTLFGRDDDRARLLAMVQPGRLVSLVGSGGIGKTRLATALAAAAVLPDGQAMIELAPVSEAEALVGTVARALEMPPTNQLDRLLSGLRSLSLLLVLDNCEHLREPVAALAQELLHAAPGVALLVTSQEPLGLADEQVLRLEPLACPAADDLASVQASPAAMLFVARAEATDPAFVLDDDNAAAVAEVCRRLDGLPLALELAAARVAVLGAAGVLERLRQPLALLTRGASGAPARQQTLRGAMQWSHGLLDGSQKAVFRRLSVFAGSFSLGAAQHVAAAPGLAPELDEWGLLDRLEALVGKSLLQVVASGDVRRFRLLESARHFARERLAEAGETDATRRRHAQALLAIFQQADERYTGEAALPWAERLLLDLPNLRAALQWATGAAGDTPLAIELAAAAGTFWAVVGLDSDAGPVLRQLIPRLDTAVPLSTQARFWLAVANRRADPSFSWQEAHAAAEQAVHLARGCVDRALLHRALSMRMQTALRVGVDEDVEATIAEMRAQEGEDWTPLQRRARRAAEDRQLWRRGDWTGYATRVRQERALLADAGDEQRGWVSAHDLALAEVACGRADEAVAVMQQAVDTIRARGLMRRCWMQVAMLAMAHIETGHAEPAAVLEAVRLMRDAGAPLWMACHLVLWLAQQQRVADAARLLGWAECRYVQRGEAPSAHGIGARQRALQILHAAASAEQLTTWQREGARWLDDDACAVLLRPVDLSRTGRDGAA